MNVLVIMAILFDHFRRHFRALTNTMSRIIKGMVGSRDSTLISGQFRRARHLKRTVMIIGASNYITRQFN